MLTAFTVSGYRSFERYVVDGLSRLNLFIGANSSGKTSLLEAIEFLIARGDPFALLRTADRRGETRPPDDPRFSGTLADLTYLFHNYDLQPESTPRIELTGNRPYGSINALVRPLTARERRDDSILHAPGEAVPARGLEITRDKKTSSALLPVDSDGALLISRRRLSLDRVSPGPRYRRRQFLTPDSLSTDRLLALWNHVQRVAREDEVVEAVRLVVDDLKSIHFLASSKLPRKADVLTGLRDGRRVPLGSQGDGMRRVLALSLSLINSADGFLFVDELESGLHWSVMRDMWRFLIQASLLSSVQVMATSHSLDCLRGLASLHRQQPDLAAEVSVFKLDRRLEEAVRLDSDEVDAAVRQGIEIR